MLQIGSMEGPLVRTVLDEELLLVQTLAFQPAYQMFQLLISIIKYPTNINEPNSLTSIECP